MKTKQFKSDMKQLSFIIDKKVSVFALELKKMLGRDLSAVILGGGYGHNEGGIIRNSSGLRAYNDLDLFLVVQSKSRLNKNKMELCIKRLAKQLGVKIDIGNLIIRSKIKNLPHTLMYHDLFTSHKVVYGPKDILIKNEPDWVDSSLPKGEISQYLLNRGFGLIMSLRYFQGTESTEDETYVKRNSFKAIQALGDCILIEANMYDLDLDERSKRLRFLSRKQPKEFSDLCDMYAMSIKFKRDPMNPLYTADIYQVLPVWINWFLKIMSKRLNCSMPNVGTFLTYSGPIEGNASGVKRTMKNLLLNIMTFRVSVKHPREHLYKNMMSLMNTSNENTSILWNLKSSAFVSRWSRIN